LMYGHVEVQFDVKIMSVNRKAMEKKWKKFDVLIIRYSTWSGSSKCQYDVEVVFVNWSIMDTTWKKSIVVNVGFVTCRGHYKHRIWNTTSSILVQHLRYSCSTFV
jgi:hypothetical protein